MNFQEYRKQKLQDPELRKAYDDLGPEYEIIRAMIDGREALQLSQQELALRTGINQSHLSRLESGNYGIALYGVTGSENNPASVLSAFCSDQNPFYQNESFDAMIQQTTTCNNAAQLTDLCMQMENHRFTAM